MMKMRLVFAGFMCFWFSGCATLSLKNEKVSFEEPGKYLDVKPLEPDKTEVKGLALRFSKPESAYLNYTEMTRIFMQIENKEGLGTSFVRKTSQNFIATDSKDKWIINSSSSLEGSDADNTKEKIEMSSRGEILRCIFGEHDSKEGKIIIKDWHRDSIFPENPVRIGDKWSYIETMKVELDSFWVSREMEKPDTITSTCTLQGFANVNNVRCAVITSNVKNVKEENLSALFKKMKLKVTSFATETMYFDYKSGKIIGKIVSTKHFTISENSDFSDFTESQTITVLDSQSAKK